MSRTRTFLPRLPRYHPPANGVRPRDSVARVKTRSIVLAAVLALGCGGSPSAATTTQTAASNTTSSAREPVVTTCEPAGSALRYELLDMPTSMLVVRAQRGTCTLLPSNADEPPFAFVVQLLSRERTDPERAGLDAEQRTQERETIVARGELELLGRTTRWMALGGEQPLVGDGETRVAVVDLTRHELHVAVSFGASTPEATRAEVLGALARMRVVGVEQPTDALLYDPTVAVCQADGVPLVVPVPEGGAHQTSWPEQCMVSTSADPDAAAWSIWIGSIGTSDAGAEQLLAREPDGARAWAEQGLAPARVVGEGTTTLLGTATPYFVLDGEDELHRPRRFVVARARRGDRHVVAVITIDSAAAPDPALPDRLLAALPGIREP